MLLTPLPVSILRRTAICFQLLLLLEVRRIALRPCLLRCRIAFLLALPVNVRTAILHLLLRLEKRRLLRKVLIIERLAGLLLHGHLAELQDRPDVTTAPLLLRDAHRIIRAASHLSAGLTAQSRRHVAIHRAARVYNRRALHWHRRIFKIVLKKIRHILAALIQIPQRRILSRICVLHVVIPARIRLGAIPCRLLAELDLIHTTASHHRRF